MILLTKNSFQSIIKNIFIIILFLAYIIIKYYNILFFDYEKEYDLVISSSYSDIHLFFKHLKFYKKYLNYSDIILIAPSNSSYLFFNDTSFLFIPEESLLPKKKINDFLLKMRLTTTKRNGWYLQQFLKMAYSRICKKEYYLIFDIDTIPIKHIKMFKNNKPYFDMKTEHNIPYFITMNRLISGLKFAKRSYISEHMIIKTDLMKSLLNEIEMNFKLPGKFFWEKILMAMDMKDINYSAFSEYETYGSYVDTKYPNVYKHRDWHSKRDANSYFGNTDNLNEEYIKWLSYYYSALSFEKYDKFNVTYLEIIKEKCLRKCYKPQEFFNKFQSFLKKE